MHALKVTGLPWSPWEGPNFAVWFSSVIKKKKKLKNPGGVFKKKPLDPICFQILLALMFLKLLSNGIEE